MIRFLHRALVMKATRSAPVAKLVVVIDDDPLVLEAMIAQPPIPKSGNLGSRKSSCPVSSQKNMRQSGRTNNSRSISLRIYPVPAKWASSFCQRPPPRLGDPHAVDLDRARAHDDARPARAVASPKPISTASRLLLSNSVHIRHEQSVGHSFLKMPDHRSLGSWY